MRLRQPANGARAAIDPVLLAAAVPAEPQHTVLEIGCGSGAASLCLAARVAQCKITGLELQRDLVRLANDNAALNGTSDRITAIAGDLLRPPPRFSAGTFDHVMANPPFVEQGRGTPSSNPARTAANIEGEATLADWLRFGLTMLRDKGTLTVIHRADRIDALLGWLAGRAGDIAIFPLWPAADRPAGRILLRARKQIAAPARVLPGLILHEPDGRFTAAADAILRDAAPLSL